MGTSPWFGIGLGAVVVALASSGLARRTSHRLSHYLFLVLGLLSILQSLLELVH